jgi:2-oxoisovalerate dehydrogenase E1 component alpha subunit
MMLRNFLKLQKLQQNRSFSCGNTALKNIFPNFKGDITSEPDFVLPENLKPQSIYQVMDNQGNITNKSQDPDLDSQALKKMYKVMYQLHTLDTIMYEAQRQGRITFYLTSHGESAIHVGTASAMTQEDLVFCQYREAGVLLWRGYAVEDCCHQILGNVQGTCKGKQAPIHYGSKDLNYVTISSTIATQIPQAAGAAYAFKRNREERVVATYFGDGGSSTGDAHVGMNFASVYDVPVIFICRNNGYAISTPVSDQYRGDGIASRGPGYGIATIRVDGNDLLAVYNATKKARLMALSESRPVLIEAMTYRFGHHSTSDDSTAYRSMDEMTNWNDNNNPIDRFAKYMKKRGIWTAEYEAQVKTECMHVVTEGLKAAEKQRYASPLEIFQDVYNVQSKNLQNQEKSLRDHLKRYENKYPLDKHEKV